MVAQDASIDKVPQLNDVVKELSEYVLQAAKEGVAADQVEQDIFRNVLQIGRLAMSEFLGLQGTGDLGPSVRLPDGKVVKRLKETRSRVYMTIFGEFKLERTVYGTREGQKIDWVPLDDRLSLPESKFSYLLQDWDQMIATDEPYQKVSTVLERILGIGQHVDSLERMSRQMTDDAEAFCWSREAPAAEEEGPLLVFTADGKGVPIRRAADAAVIHDHQHKPGPKPDRKKMATLGAVYTVDRFARTAQQVIDALFADPAQDRPDWRRPEPRHKHVYASLNYQDADGEMIDGQVSVFGWIAEEVKARDPQGNKEKVCIMDGQESLWNINAAFQQHVSTTEVLDLLHVTPRIWRLAHIFCPRNDKTTERFVRQRVLCILEGGVDSVVRGIRRMSKTRHLAAAQRRVVATICNYFQKNKQRMRYDVFLERGYPIASGVIEGACRHVVKDRLERTGMSWTIRGARAMLLLRAIFTTDQWNDYMKYRTQREQQRIHPYRKIAEQAEWPIAG